MGTQTYGPWKGGFNNLFDENEIAPDELYIAENIDIDARGVISSSTGRVGIQEDMIDYVSGWVINGSVVKVTDSGVTGVDVSFPELSEDDERLLKPLPGGSHVCAWKGRTFITKGPYILWSEPFQYGVYDPIRNFVQMQEDIIWMAPLETGIYVGLQTSVVFLKGNGPKTWEQTTVSGMSWEGCSAVMKTTYLKPEMVKGASVVAVWFGQSGFEFGLPSGDVVRPQSERIKLTEMFKGRLFVDKDRLTVVALY